MDGWLAASDGRHIAGGSSTGVVCIWEVGQGLPALNKVESLREGDLKDEPGDGQQRQQSIINTVSWCGSAIAACDKLGVVTLWSGE